MFTVHAKQMWICFASTQKQDIPLNKKKELTEVKLNLVAIKLRLHSDLLFSMQRSTTHGD